jgi:hypothetical protein
VATATVLNFAVAPVHSDYSYLAVAFSPIDILGWASEPALRSPGVQFDKSSLAFANIFAPRLEVLLGIPDFSNHVALLGGLSLRAAVPVQVGDKHYRYSYGWPFELPDEYKDRPADYFGRSVETSLGIAYIP